MTLVDSGIGPRMLPVLGELNRDFWTGGGVGELRIYHCPRCGRWIHPPNPTCGACGCREARAEATSGKGTVFAYTLNHQLWHPELRVPYLLALVELREQDGLRLNTNLVGCDPGEVTIGMPVRVVFEQHGEIFVPLFEPEP